jgi:prefoldin subunit 1
MATEPAVKMDGEGVERSMLLVVDSAIEDTTGRKESCIERLLLACRKSISPSDHVIKASAQIRVLVCVLIRSPATMSVPDDALRRVLQELQTQAITSNRAIGSTRALLTTREREKKLLQLTRNEIGSVDEEGKGERVYRGVGKMWVFSLVKIAYSSLGTDADVVRDRFVQEPLKELLGAMNGKEKEINDDIASLGKKLTVSYK